MAVNWDIVVRIIVPLLALVLGKFLDGLFARNPKLISYVGHVSAFTLNVKNQTQVYTHAIVVRNVGKQAANNVRIGHNVLPDCYQIYPSVPHNVERVPTGGAEIVISRLVAGEQLTISYLYFPPLTYSQINTYTKSDEGFAKIINIIPTPQMPKWQSFIIWVLVFWGSGTLLYFAVLGILFLLGQFSS